MKEAADDIDELIAKVLAGEASEKEAHAVSIWTAQDDANRRYFEHLQVIFQKAAAGQVSVQFDTDAAWQKVKNKLPVETGPATLNHNVQTPGFGRGAVLRIAAGIALIAAIGYGLNIFIASPPQQKEIAATGTVHADTLPDGSTAFLNHKSKLVFQYDPSKKIREIRLAGEAFFAVKHEATKPFIIHTDDVLIKDIGTAFNVRAWPENKIVEVEVEEGEVQFYTLSNPGMTVHAGETGMYDKELKLFSKTDKTDTNVLAYKTKVFRFNNTDLRSVVALVGSVYNVNIRLSNDALNLCRLTVNFDNDTLDTVIDVLAETMSLTVERKESEIILSGTGCIQ